MKTKEDVREKLEEALETLDYEDLQVTAELDPGHRLVAVVTTPEFEGVDEAERQSETWQPVFDQLDDEEQALISFIFTNTPDEEEEIEEEERRREENP